MDETIAESKSEKALRELFASGHPLHCLQSSDEERIEGLLRRAARQYMGKPVPYWSWSITEGLREGDGPARAITDPRAALEFIAEHDTPSVFHLKDFHEALRFFCRDFLAISKEYYAAILA
jgi:hypothetical protein